MRCDPARALVVAETVIVASVRSATRELAPLGIRVNAVAPGPVDTPLLGPSGRELDHVSSLPVGRLGRPDENVRLPPCR